MYPQGLLSLKRPERPALTGTILLCLIQEVEFYVQMGIFTIHYFVMFHCHEDTLKGMDFRALREGFQSRGEFQRGQAMLSLVAAIVFDLVWICLVCTFVSNHFSRRGNLREEAIQQIRIHSSSIPVPSVHLSCFK